MDTIYPITELLCQMAGDDFSHHQLLRRIINQLFIDLDMGHSCTSLAMLVQDLQQEGLNTTLAECVEALLVSGLVTVVGGSERAVKTNPVTMFIADGQIKTNLLQGSAICIGELLGPYKIKYVNQEILLFISKYLNYELTIADKIHELAMGGGEHCMNEGKTSADTTLTKIMTTLNRYRELYNLPNFEQVSAINNVLLHKFSIITGGPGSGKTTTITFLLSSLYALYGEKIKIRICAPTGKATRRVQESILANLTAKRELFANIELISNFAANEDNFCTIHRLLGARINNIYFKHNQKNPLLLDVLIIDESSMVSLPLFSKLLTAINANSIKHLVFLGDKNQLSSVEEGYVFASLVANAKAQHGHDLFSEPAKVVSELIVSNRNQGDIGKFAVAILRADFAKIRQMLGSTSRIKLQASSLANIKRELFLDGSNLLRYIEFIFTVGKNTKNPITLYSKFSEAFGLQSVLCATNVGILGSRNINIWLEKLIKQYLATTDTWYSGRPIIVSENDYALKLNNGDVGFAVVHGDEVNIIFENGKSFPPEVLPPYQLAYAITIHKAQGSEFDHVNIILANKSKDNISEYEIVTRELLYTAVTRAKSSITLFADMKSLDGAINKVTRRNTGLDYLVAL